MALRPWHGYLGALGEDRHVLLAPGVPEVEGDGVVQAEFAVLVCEKRSGVRPAVDGVRLAGWQSRCRALFFAYVPAGPAQDAADGNVRGQLGPAPAAIR
jgi:hypothetical protein